VKAGLVVARLEVRHKGTGTRPVGYVATPADEDCTYAMLVSRHGETLAQLLARLDHAIHKAFTEQVFTDEINPPPTRS